jgi:hypothetical protein
MRVGGIAGRDVMAAVAAGIRDESDRDIVAAAAMRIGTIAGGDI